MKVKVTKNKVTIECRPCEAYLIERGLMRYGDALGNNGSVSVAADVCAMAYAIQRPLVEKGLFKLEAFREAVPGDMAK